MRIELTSSDWKSEVMPLYDIRKLWYEKWDSNPQGNHSAAF
ncbi:hypothetical protein [Escherichia phage vB_vPM_PD112]|uniref:Uncharacterized protein n=2 Tax=Tequatrovirus TaxID=10663 RepID=A0A386KLR6_9CAUD|nr:hypothetical protein KMC20_gp245 [Escherichia phage vB_vPM_PD112]YP_010075402.1 hypothetical protein KMC29_gp136 [Salmonella phage pSe_SNUABM_01]AYD85403.1 hypothetical protein [Escherichia phage vB_vPM_PD112]QHA33508.1 hypothetical protein pSeSNUABM01_136 [Salmonella phage pSe_SNUABM_01]WJJ57275.1 hypothetical protein [Escherichia phage LH2]